MSELSHFDARGASRMVDVAAKAVTERLAVATGQVSMKSTTLQLILDRRAAKGDVLEVARLAGIMGAKRVADLIPLCHQLALDGVTVDLEPDVAGERVVIRAQVKTTGRTGVEMEALTAVTIAALTIYDMCKAVDREMVLGEICLQEKKGGKSGHFQRVPPGGG